MCTNMHEFSEKQAQKCLQKGADRSCGVRMGSARRRSAAVGDQRASLSGQGFEVADQGLGLDVVVDVAAFFFAGEYAGALQNLEMPGDHRAVLRKGGRHTPDVRAPLFDKKQKNVDAHGLAEGSEELGVHHLGELACDFGSGSDGGLGVAGDGRCTSTYMCTRMHTSSGRAPSPQLMSPKMRRQVAGRIKNPICVAPSISMFWA